MGVSFFSPELPTILEQNQHVLEVWFHLQTWECPYPHLPGFLSFSRVNSEFFLLII